MNYLAIDPGGTVGWAVFDDDGEELGRGKMKQEMFWHSIKYLPNLSASRIQFTPRGDAKGLVLPVLIDDVVYESYYQDPGIKSGGSRGPAQEVIGVLKYLCAQAGIAPTAQRSAILPVAMKWTGYVQDTVHLRDEDSAWLHGQYYLENEGVIELAKRPGGVSATL